LVSLSRDDGKYDGVPVRPVSLIGFSGPAGVGKTFRLMATLDDTIAADPLKEGQSVLALTYMNGSRRRLDGKLRQVPRLNGRYLCTTIDRFAWELQCTGSG
jgi:hypothetical protein